MILAPVTVNGKFQGRLIVDTEAPLTLLTFKAAISLGIAPRLGVITSVQAPVAVAIWRPAVTLSSLRVGDVSLEDIEAVVSEPLEASERRLDSGRRARQELSPSLPRYDRARRAEPPAPRSSTPLWGTPVVR